MTASPVVPARFRLQGIRKRFGATAALGGVDLEIAPGEVHALVGENGAGKSTLMKILAGVYPPDGGQMWIDGRDYAPRGPVDARRAGIVMVHQELAIAPHLTVAENIVLGAEPVRGPFVHGSRMRRTAREALTQLGRSELPLDAPAGALSIGAQQVIEIARAVALGCRVLVLDEPTSSLSHADTERLFALVGRLRQEGHSVVYISHFLEEVRSISDRFTVLRDGVTVGSGKTAGVPLDEIARLMVGRSVQELYIRSPRQPGTTLLAVEALRGRLRPVSSTLEVRRGEVLGVAGLVGAGRTELLRAIFGLDEVRSGRIAVGVHVGAASPARRWAQGAGLVSEDRKNEGLALGLTVADNMTLTRLPRVVRPSAQAAAVRRWVERLGIRCTHPFQCIGELSGGNQQKVAFARLLHHDVDLLLLDEPTRGVDVGAKQTIYRCIDEMACAGKAVLVVSSYLPELLGACDRVAVMSRGILGPARPVAEWTEHEVIMAASMVPSQAA